MSRITDSLKGAFGGMFAKNTKTPPEQAYSYKEQDDSAPELSAEEKRAETEKFMKSYGQNISTVVVALHNRAANEDPHELLTSLHAKNALEEKTGLTRDKLKGAIYSARPLITYKKGEIKQRLSAPTDTTSDEDMVTHFSEFFFLLITSSSRATIELTHADYRTSKGAKPTTHTAADWFKDNKNTHKALFTTLTKKERDAIFDQVLDYGLYEAFNTIINDKDPGKSTLPSELRRQWNSWCKANPEKIAETTNNIETEEASSPTPKLTISDAEFFTTFKTAVRAYLDPESDKKAAERAFNKFFDDLGIQTPLAKLYETIARLPDDKFEEFMANQASQTLSYCLTNPDSLREQVSDIVKYLMMHRKEGISVIAKASGTPTDMTELAMIRQAWHAMEPLTDADYAHMRASLASADMGDLIDEILERESILPQEFIKKIRVNPTAPSQHYSIADKQAFFDGVGTYDLRWIFAGHDQITPEINDPIAKKINQVADAASRRTRLARSWEHINTLDTKNMRRFQFMQSLSGSTRRGTAERIIGGAATTQDPYKTATELWGSALNHEKTRNTLFLSAVNNSFLPQLYFILNAFDSHSPKGTVDNLLKWCEDQGIDIDQIIEDYELQDMDDIEAIIEKGRAARAALSTMPEEPETTDTSDPTPPEDEYSDLDFTPVDGLQVVTGASEEPIAIDATRNFEKAATEKTPVNHIQLIKNKLGLYMDIDGEIEVLGSLAAANRIRKGEPDYELKIIQFTTTDGTHHQVATNNWLGSGTHIIKPPVPIDVSQAKLIDIAELRENGACWSIRHKTEETYLQDIATHCSTPKDELEPYLPRFYGWSNDPLIVEKVIHTAAATLRATGLKLASGDKKPLQHGALKGKVTPRRLIASLPSVGFSGRDELYEWVFNEHPELEAHLAKPSVDARVAFNQAVSVVEAMDIVPQLAFEEDFTICDRPLAEVSEFFELSEKGCVTHWQELMIDPTQTRIPTNWDDFMVATGIAVRKGNLLEPNPKRFPAPPPNPRAQRRLRPLGE